MFMLHQAILGYHKSKKCREPRWVTQILGTKARIEQPERKQLRFFFVARKWFHVFMPVCIFRYY